MKIINGEAATALHRIMMLGLVMDWETSYGKNIKQEQATPISKMSGEKRISSTRETVLEEGWSLGIHVRVYMSCGRAG